MTEAAAFARLKAMRLKGKAARRKGAGVVTEATEMDGELGTESQDQ